MRTEFWRRCLSSWGKGRRFSVTLGFPSGHALLLLLLLLLLLIYFSLGLQIVHKIVNYNMTN